MKFVAFFNIYNESQFLEEALEAVLPLVDEYIIVDGAFDGFPDGQGQSVDDTPKIVSDFMQKHPDLAVSYFFNDKPWVGMSKVELMMRNVEDGDYILRMNGDEVFVLGNRDTLETYVTLTGELPLYQICQYRPPIDGTHYDWIPKLVKKTPSLKITNKHLALTNSFVPKYYLDGGRNRVSPDVANIPRAVALVCHKTEQRNVMRQQLNFEWTKYFNTHLRYE